MAARAYSWNAPIRQPSASTESSNEWPFSYPEAAYFSCFAHVREYSRTRDADAPFEVALAGTAEYVWRKNRKVLKIHREKKNSGFPVKNHKTPKNTKKAAGGAPEVPAKNARIIQGGIRNP